MLNGIISHEAHQDLLQGHISHGQTVANCTDALPVLVDLLDYNYILLKTSWGTHALHVSNSFSFFLFLSLCLCLSLYVSFYLTLSLSLSLSLSNLTPAEEEKQKLKMVCSKHLATGLLYRWILDPQFHLQ
jgi:hypothetical protein